MKISKAAGELGAKCPQCGSRLLWRAGYVPTRTGKQQRLKCYDCAASFYIGCPGAKVGSKKPKSKVAPPPVGKPTQLGEPIFDNR